MAVIPTIERRRELVATENVTLDGEPAVIAGAVCMFPVVATLDNARAYEYSWATVEHVVNNNNGAFKS